MKNKTLIFDVKRTGNVFQKGRKLDAWLCSSGLFEANGVDAMAEGLDFAGARIRISRQPFRGAMMAKTCDVYGFWIPRTQARVSLVSRSRRALVSFWPDFGDGRDSYLQSGKTFWIKVTLRRK